MAGALARIGVGALEEARGSALPRTPEQLATPAALNALLSRHAPEGWAPLPEVRAARLPGVFLESSNCNYFLVELDLEAPGPRTVFAKLPCPGLATRTFANAVGFWEVEATFCARVASRVPIRVPRVYAVAHRGGRFVLLLENLQELPGVHLFVNRDMAAGTDPARASQCLRTFAELHAAFWGWPAERRDALVPARLHPYLARDGAAATRALNAAAVAPAHRAAPDVFTERHVALFRKALAKWDRLIASWYGGPLTLIHGDSHLANCFEYATAEAPRIGLIDFQGMHWCHGLRDVQYFLIASLAPGTLAACEDELLEGYRAALAGHGVALDREEAQERYRGFSFQTLMVAVTSIGLGSLTERNETLRTVLARSVAAIDRLDFEGWLDRL
jgi:hypothetical protein